MIDTVDVLVRKVDNGVRISVNYWSFTRNKHNPVATGRREYIWETDCPEIINLLTSEKRTKVFFSQVKMLCRKFGEVQRESYKNLSIPIKQKQKQNEKS